MPVCYGKLTLQGEQDGEGGVREVADTGSEVSVLCTSEPAARKFGTPNSRA